MLNSYLNSRNKVLYNHSTQSQTTTITPCLRPPLNPPSSSTTMSTTKPNDISEEPLLDSPNDISEEEPLWYEPSFWFEPDEILQHCFWFERQFVVDVLLALLVHVFLHAVRTDSDVTWISRCLIYKSLYFALASMLYQLHMVVENRAVMFIYINVYICIYMLMWLFGLELICFVFFCFAETVDGFRCGESRVLFGFAVSAIRVCFLFASGFCSLRLVQPRSLYGTL